MDIAEILPIVDFETEGNAECNLVKSLAERGAEVEFHSFSNTATLMFDGEEMLTVDFDDDSLYIWSAFKKLL